MKNTSLRNRLLLLLISMGLLPFVILLIYTIVLSESKMVNKTIVAEFTKINVIEKLIYAHLNSLTKEVSFLSSLDLMDDILVEDIDKRVSHLLTQKADDLDMHLNFFAVNENAVVIASSDKEYISQTISHPILNARRGTYIKGSKLYIYSSIKASFDKRKNLGYLLLEYDLKNLDRYLTQEQNHYSFIVNPKTKRHIGKELPLEIKYTKSSQSIIENDYLLVYKRLNTILEDFYIVYAEDKSVALEFLYDFIKFMLYMAFFVFLLIIYLALRYSKEIVQPIENLTEVTEEIIQTKNYSRNIEATSVDEIGVLTASFNTMLTTTSKALHKLELENRLRLQRFTQLVDIFNTIIQTQSEEECLNTSLQEIKNLTGEDKLHFTKEKQEENTSEYTEIYVTDFENSKRVYYGSIILGIPAFKDKYEKDFYNSIASMITLQLDRIGLIEKTMSASNAKSAFISNMSHELRTPLNSIIGSVQYLIIYEDLNNEQIETVGSIESSAEYLLNMINEILDIAKIEAGKMEINIAAVNILTLVENSFEMLFPLADDKNLIFEFHHNDFDDKLYKTDAKMFMQIVINLISNAIKFTKKGSIVLTLKTEDNSIFVSIADSGLGIAEEDIDLLFSDFTQLENQMQQKHKGTGLGLSLSKKMAQLLGGDVSLLSKGLGQGAESIFYISMVE